MVSATPEYEITDEPSGRQGCASKLTLLLLPLVGFAGYLALGGTVVIKGDSMAPGVFDGSRCFMHPFSQASRGDLVLAQGPASVGLVVKRVVALPGDQPRLENGWLVGAKEGSDHEQLGTTRWQPDRSGGGYDRMWPNYLLTQRYGDGAPSRLPGMLRQESGFQVAPGHVFLLSDRRDESVDSRDWGALKSDAVVRVIWFCLDSGA